ncbi:MAG: hypothetical protein KY439_06435, partial [Actinobacteria bacterium]|nr:hypothetical protein [Actinomycetota bacterium]
MNDRTWLERWVVVVETCPGEEVGGVRAFEDHRQRPSVSAIERFAFDRLCHLARERGDDVATR